MTENELILSYMPLARKLAKEKKRDVGRRIYFQELEAAALYGLVTAAKDPKPNPNFYRYAKIRILGEMENYIREVTRFDNKGVFLVDDYFNHYVDESDGLKEMAHDILESLPPPINKIFEWYYFHGMNLKEIGKELGVHESWISQTMSRYKRKIRRDFRD